MKANLFAMGGGLVVLLIGRKFCLLAGKPELPYPWRRMLLKEKIFHSLRISFGNIIGYIGIAGGLIFIFNVGVYFLKLIP